MNIPDPFINRIKELLEENEAKIVINNNEIGQIKLDNGLGQGDANSCSLYNIANIPLALAISKMEGLKRTNLKRIKKEKELSQLKLKK